MSFDHDAARHGVGGKRLKSRTPGRHDAPNPEPHYRMRPFPVVDLSTFSVEERSKFMCAPGGAPLFAARPVRKARAEKLAKQHRHSEIPSSCGPWEFQGYLAKSSLPNRPSSFLLGPDGKPNGKKMQSGWAVLPLRTDDGKLRVNLKPGDASHLDMP